jgi:hypothetical protein
MVVLSNIGSWKRIPKKVPRYRAGGFADGGASRLATAMLGGNKCLT